MRLIILFLASMLAASADESKIKLDGTWKVAGNHLVLNMINKCGKDLLIEDPHSVYPDYKNKLNGEYSPPMIVELSWGLDAGIQIQKKFVWFHYDENNKGMTWNYPISKKAVDFLKENPDGIFEIKLMCYVANESITRSDKTLISKTTCTIDFSPDLKSNHVPDE